MKRYLGIPIAVAALVCIGAGNSGFGGSQYAVPVYRGPIANPNFTGKGARYHLFRTVISQGFRKGVNFAGHYTLISVGCGTDCVSTVMGDIKTGALSDFPIGGEGYIGLDISYTPDSRFVAVRWSENIDRNDCTIQQYVLTGDKFIPHGKRIVSHQPCNAE